MSAKVLVQKGDARGARKLLKDLQARFAQHPWLQEKLLRLSELAERDPEMMSKEAQFSAMRMSSRLSAKAEGRYSADETEVGDIPAYLRKKSQEGKGRKQQSEPAPAANPASSPRQSV